MKKTVVLAGVLLTGLVGVLVVLLLNGHFNGARCGPESQGAAVDRSGPVFPTTIEVNEGRLYVGGMRFQGEVRLDFSNDTLWVNRVPFPLAPTEPTKPEEPESWWRKLYADVPFVVGLVEEGYPWAQAAQEYSLALDTLSIDAGKRYYEVLDLGGSDAQAERAVREFLESSDLVDQEADVRIKKDWVALKYTGLRMEHQFRLSRKPPSKQLGASAETRAEIILGTVTDVFRPGARPGLVVISNGGMVACAGSDATEGFDQIDRGRGRGPVGGRMLVEILAEEGRVAHED